jgi:hypothetical protein
MYGFDDHYLRCVPPLPKPPHFYYPVCPATNSSPLPSGFAHLQTSGRVAPLKKNPLKNLGALLKLNPYAKNLLRMQLLAVEKRGSARAAKLAAARGTASDRKAAKKVRAGQRLAGGQGTYACTHAQVVGAVLHILNVCIHGRL